MGRLPAPALAAAICAIYVLAGKLGLSLAFVHASTSAVWPPTGIALAALLLAGLRMWPAILLGAFVVNVTTAGSVATALGIAAGNTLEALLGAWLVNRFAGGPRVFERAPDIFRFVVLAALLSTTVSATVGSTSLALGGYAPWDQYRPIWLTWWLGDAAGALVVTPALVMWNRSSDLRWDRRRVLEAVLLLLVTVLAGLVIFSGVLRDVEGRDYPLAFLAIPFLVWAAFRFGVREAATCIVLLALVAVSGTLRGQGPFAIGSQNDSLLLLQAFLATVAGTTLPLAAVVAERRRADQARQASEVAYRAMFESNPHPMWVVDRETLAFLAVNDAAVAQYGYTQAEFLGMTAVDIRPPEDAPSLMEARQALREGYNVLGQFRHWTKDRRVLDVEIASHPVLFGGRPAVLVLADDVTDRRQGEEDRRQLLEREQAARAEAEEANRTKDQFLATLSHELRTPLNAMVGWVAVLRSGRLDAPATARALEIIERNTRLQTTLIEDLLDLSRITAGKLRLEQAPVELPAVIEAAVEAARPAVVAKALTLDLRVDRKTGPVLGDAARLQQVVWNLISNAVKFTEPGGRVTVVLEPVGAHVRIQVSDTGRGISKEFLPHIFDHFRQAEGATTRAHEGLGLGLAIVRHLVDAHDGSVRADSDGPGQGATFTVELPLASAASAGRGVPAVRERGGPSLDAVRVLAVDDNADAGGLVAAALGQYGADTTVVRSADEALQALSRASFDVLVADIAMPGKDGYDLIREVRAQEGAARRIPALALTALARGEDRERALAAGYAVHLSKPVQPRQLAQAVAVLAGRV